MTLCLLEMSVSAPTIELFRKLHEEIITDQSSSSVNTFTSIFFLCALARGRNWGVDFFHVSALTVVSVVHFSCPFPTEKGPQPIMRIWSCLPVPQLFSLPHLPGYPVVLAW